jgi:hypothetical protein
VGASERRPCGAGRLVRVRVSPSPNLKP